jgi:NOL1/NOP2/fmu family ribosome biogenesis protein
MLRLIQEKYPITVNEIPLNYGFEPGIHIKGPVRLYPHKVKGEGHFAGLCTYEGNVTHNAQVLDNNQPPEALKLFMDQYLVSPLNGHFKIINDQVYLMPKKTLNMKGLKVVKSGWHLGKLVKNRFEPSHAFALGLKINQFKNVINFKRDDIQVIKYLKCETLHCSGEKGYNLICVDGFSLGWGKWAQGKLKNLYPSPWRLS